MGIQDELRDSAKSLGKKIGDLAKEEGEQILGDLKEKLAGQAEDLKQNATRSVTNLVEEQKSKLTEKASDLLKKK
jgi:hypothetical protein